MKDQAHQSGTSSYCNLYPKRFPPHIYWLLFLPLLFCCTSPSPPSIHVDKMSTKAHIINSQTLAPNFELTPSEMLVHTMTFHGITEEGKEALGDGILIFRIHCLNSDKVTFPLPEEPYDFVEEVPHSYSDQFEPKRYYFEADFIVSETVTFEKDFPQVLELEFRTLEEIPIGRMNYRLPIPDALQVQKYAEAYASGGDIADRDLSPGAMTFMPSLQLPLYTPEFPDINPDPYILDSQKFSCLNFPNGIPLP